MPGRRDQDALSWDGDDDPTLDVGGATARTTTPADAADPVALPVEGTGAPAALPAGFTAVGKDSGTVGRVNADGTVTMPGDRRPMSSGSLVALGVIGGIYLLYAIGWIAGGLRLVEVVGALLSPTGQAPPTWQGGNVVAVWVAAAAPAIWFITGLVLTRGVRAWARWTWLGAGILLLVPWPLLMVGASG